LNITGIYKNEKATPEPPFCARPRQRHDEEDCDTAHYKVENIWIEVSTSYDFDGYSTVIGHQSYERIDAPDLSGAKLLKDKELSHGNSNRDIAVYIYTAFARPYLHVYPGVVEEVMKRLRLTD
jgi:hypothetical protein